MRLCNDTVTVFNARRDPATQDITLHPTVIHGASWFATQAETVDAKGGFIAANKVIVRIPADADAGGSAYADPVAYRAAADPSGLWTLGGGDITLIAKGEIAGAGWTEAQLRATYPTMVVQGVTDNRRAPNAPHFKVVGA